MATAPKRSPRRRSSEEVQANILAAARELFVAQGYRSTTTKEIALKAAVAEPLIFSNFGSKAALFEATVVSAFSGAVGEFVSSWAEPPDTLDDAEAINRMVLKRLFELGRQNRDILRLLMAAQVHGDEGLSGLADTVSQGLASALQEVQQPEFLAPTTQFFDLEDPECFIPAVVAMVLGLTIMDDWVFPAGKRRPSRARQVRAVQQLVMYGVYGPKGKPQS